MVFRFFVIVVIVLVLVFKDWKLYIIGRVIGVDDECESVCEF